MNSTESHIHRPANIFLLTLSLFLYGCSGGPQPTETPSSPNQFGDIMASQDLPPRSSGFADVPPEGYGNVPPTPTVGPLPPGYVTDPSTEENYIQSEFIDQTS